jgi:RNA ligase
MAVVDIEVLQALVGEGYLTMRPHPTADLLIWNYTAKAQYNRHWTPETMMCRGLITTGAGEIVARPFCKFFNYEEYTGDPPATGPFTVTEKMDGSLGISYFFDDTLSIATRGSFTSEQATRANDILSRKYADFIPVMQAWPYYTLLWEIVYPENRIVVNYGDIEDLVLLAVIFTETGEEEDFRNPHVVEMWPFPLVKQYDGITDIEELRKIEEANKEGFVIRFESGLRLKMKFAEYVRLHRLITGVNARIIWDLLRNNQPFEELLTNVPDEFYQWVLDTSTDLVAQFARIESESTRVYEQVKYLPTRKEQAAIVTKTPYAAVVFRMLDNKGYADIIWKQLRPTAEKPYKEQDLETE